MKDENILKEPILKSDNESDKIEENLRRIELEGIQNVLKYFDRIHDKLFTFNNILIAGYFALSQFYDTISIYGILIPIANLGILLVIEYRMMERSRFESNVREHPLEKIKRQRISINRTNRYSLYTIASTSIVVIIFIFSLFSIDKIKKDNVKTIKCDEITRKL